MPQSRAEELTYYDELGVPRNASAEQIKDAFRGLARLLHPDQHVDAQLKSLAELQMRKLNRIYAVLSDMEQRRLYDRSLVGDRPAVPAPPAEKLAELFSGPTGGRIAWLGAVAVAIVFLFWLATDVAPNPLTAGSEKTAGQPVYAAEQTVPRPAASSDTASLLRDLKIARVERDAAIQEIARLRGQKPPVPGTGRSAESRDPDSSMPAVSPVSAPPDIQANTVAAVAIPSSSPATQPAAPRLRPQPFNGFWFFVRTQDDKKNPALYPPEFIEATISEQSGQIRGRYRSRYHITDRAISPDVNFDFSGTIDVASNTVTANWIGPGGARGEMTMKLLSEHSMRVEWSTDRLGNLQGLTSGTAALTRRLD